MKARVRGGRLLLDEPTDLPEGSEVDLVEAFAVARERQVSRMRDTFLGMLGHDLRNPVSSIHLSAATLARDPALTEPQRRAVLRIVAGSTRMSRMVGQLLDLARARLIAGFPLSRRPVDLAELVGDVVDDLRAAHPDRALDLTVEGDATGHWDADRLDAVARTLIENALHHGAADRPIHVHVGGDASVRLTVHNHGPVLPRGLLEALFEPYRAHGRREPSSGVGLGLHLARVIADAHGGQLRVTSEAEAGTLFTLELPRG